MRVLLNGEATELAAGATVAAALETIDVGARTRGVAVAVDAEVVPRSAWAQHPLADGARIEILQAVQGG